MSASWETSSAAPTPGSAAPVATPVGISWRLRERAHPIYARAPRPELLGLMALAAVLNLWALSQNGWANTYYSAAVRSMSSSWHNFLYASLDPGGVMTVDKPPLSLWVQSLSVRIFGYDQLSVLVPQALMGVASVVLVYDLVRRRFGRVGGFVAGLALAVTPMTVAISRHNNPDALLVLCCVAAVWCTVRGLERGRLRWLVLAGVSVGLGFETKMGVALTVVPGIAAAWLWITPAGRGRLHALRQLFAGGAAMVVVGGAWPALVELTPAADRPWVAGTSDNSVLSLIFGYNGLGRVEGQTGGPGAVGGRGGGGGSALFGSSPGPFRLLNSALGGQAGWLLGFAVVSGLAILVATRLRRSDPRSGWLIVVGGAFLVTAALFSAASGIFHPYYVSLLAPFTAALFGAGAAQLIGGRLRARIAGPLAIVAGVAVEVVIRGQYPGQLTWLDPVLIAVAAIAVLVLLAFRSRRVRMVAVGAVTGALLLAPSVWAIDTLGYPTSATFPSGGPAAVAGGGAGGLFARVGPGGGLSGPPGRGFGAGAAGQQLFGTGGSPPSPSGRPGGFQGAPPAGAGGGAFGPGGAGGGRFGGDQSLTAVVSYVKQHGGGTIAVASQSSAASAIIKGDVQVAGIGGFSGRESDVSVPWLAQEVRSGAIRWVLVGQTGGGFGAGAPGDTRVGSKAAMDAVAKVCRQVSLPATSSSTGSAAAGTLYDCHGFGAALEAAGAPASSS
ncbi:MAG: glycosyl transferase family 39 [Solirubrobacterales bacterium]|nr:glycosyl transferase family 39 [Solirubrobacterales bacterium]